jgi:hypothetical protein
MRNIHERVLDAPAEIVGGMLDRIGSDDDVLWPSLAWPPMRFDRPLAVGADGGHDDIRYVVSAYDPGRRVEFQFHPVTGLDGFHALELEPLGEDRCVLRHVLAARLRGRMLILVPLAVRWLHDAVLEDLLDNAERAVTGAVARPYHYSPWVRLLRRLSAPRARAAPMPAGATLVGAALDRIDYSDAYSIVVGASISADARTWADALFHGLTGMPRLSETEHEVLLGADEWHLRYRVGVLVDAAFDRVTVTVATVVQLSSRAGRIYFAVVRRFHPAVVRLLLRRASLRLVADRPANRLPGPPRRVILDRGQ